MSQITIAKVLLERGDEFSHLSLRREGAAFTVEDVEGVGASGLRQGTIFVRWSGDDEAVAHATFEALRVARNEDGFSERR